MHGTATLCLSIKLRISHLGLQKKYVVFTASFFYRRFYQESCAASFYTLFTESAIDVLFEKIHREQTGS